MRTVRIGRRAALAGGIGLLAGCETTIDQPRESRSSDFAFDRNGPNGVIVGTIEVVTPPGVFGPTANHIRMHMVPDPQPIVLEARSLSWGATLQGPNTFLRASLETVLPSGHTAAVGVFAQLAPPVRVGLSSWMLAGSSLGVLGGSRMFELALPPVSFTPRQGAVTYVGNFAMLLTSWTGPNFLNARPQLALALRDRQERDLPLLRERLAWLRAQEIAVELPQATRWPRELPV